MLICASDDRTCAQLKEYIQRGADSLLTRLYSRTIGKDEAVPVPHPSKQGSICPGRGATKKTSKDKKAQETKNTKRNGKKPRPSPVGEDKEAALVVMDDSGDDEEQEKEKNFNLSSDSYYGILNEPLTVIHPLKGCTDPYSLTRVLEEVRPMFVVLYDAELSFVRQLEVYKASRPGVALR